MSKLLPKGLWPLLAAGFVSTAGDSMHQVAIMWLIYELTGSSTATGLIGMAQYLPAVLVGVFAGAAVDRMNRQRVMIVSDGARVVLVALIPTLYFLQHMSGLLLGLLAFSIALFTTLFYPARESIVPMIVQQGELTQAGSVLQGSYATAYFAGPMLAAAILPWAKISGLFYADAITYAVSLGFILLLRPRPIVVDMENSAERSVKAGLRYAKESGLIRGLLLITAVDNLFIMGPAMVGAPLYIRLHLGLGAQAYAAAEAAFALGMIAGSILVNRFGSHLPRGKTLLMAIIWDGITFLPFLFTRSLLAVMIAWFVHSIGIPFIVVPRTTLVQTEVPSHFQGRVFSLVYLTVVGLTAISCGLTGVIAEVLPVNVLFAVIGISATVVGASGWWVRELREVK
jgi:DHA3 family macrolide efflux protein-like MFS transporter